MRKIEEKFNRIQIYIGYKIQMMGTGYVQLPIKVERSRNCQLRSVFHYNWDHNMKGSNNNNKKRV